MIRSWARSNMRPGNPCAGIYKKKDDPFLRKNVRFISNQIIQQITYKDFRLKNNSPTIYIGDNRGVAIFFLPSSAHHVCR